jgi:hypothetical protein
MLALALLFMLAPGLAAAQDPPDPKQEPKPKVASAQEAEILAKFSAESRAKLEAMLESAREKQLPTEPTTNRMAEGKAKGAPEPEIVAETRKVMGHLEAAHGVLVRVGREKPNPDEVSRGASVLARGASTADPEIVASKAPAGRSLVVAFEVLSDLADRGLPVERAPLSASHLGSADGGLRAAVSVSEGVSPRVWRLAGPDADRGTAVVEKLSWHLGRTSVNLHQSDLTRQHAFEKLAQSQPRTRDEPLFLAVDPDAHPGTPAELNIRTAGPRVVEAEPDASDPHQQVRRAERLTLVNVLAGEVDPEAGLATSEKVIVPRRPGVLDGLHAPGRDAELGKLHGPRIEHDLNRLGLSGLERCGEVLRVESDPAHADHPLARWDPA